MPLPATGPTDLDAVKAQLEIGDTADDARLTTIVAAVNAVVRTLPVAGSAEKATQAEADTTGWPASIREGATMLAGRLWRRKDSPAGVVALGELGPVYVQRNDPDIAMLLELGDWARPGVG